MGWQRCDQVLFSEQNSCVRVLEHELKAFGWIAEIDREVGASCLENSEYCCNESEGAIDIKTDEALRTNSVLDQMVRDPVRLSIQLVVRKVVASKVSAMACGVLRT